MSYNIEKGVRIAVRTLKAPYCLNLSANIINKINISAFSLIVKIKFTTPFQCSDKFSVCSMKAEQSGLPFNLIIYRFLY